ncbi:hypothetical protein F5Y16DRAFT_411631 [Xylariaceae sp. FL0255]|nr:hypothetical protein F5Y16DRAFT_411631 [Xylariaceae sp. FL0255]
MASPTCLPIFAVLFYCFRYGSVTNKVILLSYLVLFVPQLRWPLVQAALAAPIGWYSLRKFLRPKPTAASPLAAWTGPGKPLLFPCQTTHTRLFPKKHSFVYSYLMVGVPIGWSGSVGSMVSVAEAGQSFNTWYRIDPSDYLSRGNSHLGLRGKLDAFLTSQGVKPPQYPFAYLVTAARFLGYHFNPVSFWYLYSVEKQLTAMILEVNNTFDERRMYLLTWDSKTDGNTVADAAHFAEPAIQALKKSWPKDFHVSPFNSRKGTYSLIAHDPLASKMEGKGPIDNTINLKSSKDQAKLVARIFSSGEALDPLQIGRTQELVFLLKWWWVGFVTFPRIVKEAGLLFFKRQLHVWYRPEPLKESIGRHATKEELELEPIFRRYLRHLVSQSSSSLVVRYISSGVVNVVDEQMLSQSALRDPSAADQLELRVLTPAFYSRFVHYAHDLEAVFCELNENCTIWISNPHLLPKLVVTKQPPPLTTSSYVDYGYFMAIKNLRQLPEKIYRPLTSAQATPSSPAKDVRGFRLSGMDGYVLAQEGDKIRHLYRHLVLKMFIADYVAWGSMELFWLEVFLLRVPVSWVFLTLVFKN